MNKIEPTISDPSFSLPITLKEKVARIQRIDKIKAEISYYTEAVKSAPKFALFYNGKIMILEDELKFI
jgi:hypothetical protein